MGSLEPAQAASRYETLRMAALGEPVPPEDRSGLVLVLRRGMWGWARALANTLTPQQTTRSSSTSTTATQPQKEVIQIFAAMALHSNIGGTP